MQKCKDFLLKYFKTAETLAYWESDEAKLVERQEALWSPIIDWLKPRNIKLDVSKSIMPFSQSLETLKAAANVLEQFDPFKLAAFETCTRSLKSFCLSLCLFENFIDACREINSGIKAPEDFNDGSLATVHTTMQGTAILEAGRLSLDADGKPMDIVYEGDASEPSGIRPHSFE